MFTSLVFRYACQNIPKKNIADINVRLQDIIENSIVHATNEVVECLLSSLFNVGHQFSNLIVKAFFGFLLELGKITFKVRFLPFLFPFGVQRRLDESGSVKMCVEKNRT
jgi:hypothetical protein